MMKIVATLISIFAFSSLLFIQKSIHHYENLYHLDFLQSYNFDGYDNCLPTIEETHPSYSVYVNFCNIHSPQTLETYTKSVYEFLQKNRNSPSFRTRPFTSSLGYFYLDKNVHEGEEVQRQMKALANSEFSQFQPLINFFTMDCSLEKSEAALKILPQLKYPLIKGEILAKVNECYLINGNKDVAFLQQAIALLPSHFQGPYLDDERIAHYINDNLPIRLPSSFIHLFLNQEKLKKLHDVETVFYYHDLSQFQYRLDQFQETTTSLDYVLELFPISLERKTADIIESILLTRKAKSLLNSGDLDATLVVLEKIKAQNRNLIGLPNHYYPDMSLPQMFLQLKRLDIVDSYFIDLIQIGQLEQELYDQWMKEIANGKTPHFELDIFKRRNAQSIEKKIIASEEKQIIMFTESRDLGEKVKN